MSIRRYATLAERGMGISLRASQSCQKNQVVEMSGSFCIDGAFPRSRDAYEDAGPVSDHSQSKGSFGIPV
jgi:hypothetical protein